MFTSDTPIASPEDDILNRNEYAERLATTIIEWDKSDSIVFAINAKWGYGKSSLLNLVKHYVKKKTQTQSPKEFFKPRTKLHARMKFNGKRIFPVDYYPWGFDDQDRIHNALFKEISKAVKWLTKWNCWKIIPIFLARNEIISLDANFKIFCPWI